MSRRRIARAGESRRAFASRLARSKTAPDAWALFCLGASAPAQPAQAGARQGASQAPPFDTTARFFIEGVETTIAEHLEANAADPETASEIADALRQLQVGQSWTYNGGAAGLFEYVRVA